MKSQPRRAPGPKRPFVNRSQELMLIEKKLETGCRGEQMKSVLICFWGAFGMGKSWLLLEIERRYSRWGERQINGPNPVITARLDLSRVPTLWQDYEADQEEQTAGDDNDETEATGSQINISTINKQTTDGDNDKTSETFWQDQRLDREKLIRELWHQLAGQLGVEAQDLGQASPEEWAEAFVTEVTRWSAKSATPLIMLDTVDDLIDRDEATFFWLEQQLIERLAMTDRVLFVFTSRGELRRWKRFQVRRRIDSHRLEAFDLETSGRQVQANREVSQRIYRHAFGHPLFSERVGTLLERRGFNLQKVMSNELHLELSDLRDTLTEVVDEILEGESADLPAMLARYACVLRWVSVEPLRFLAENLGLIEKDRGDAYYLDQISQLQNRHLLYWDSDKNSYSAEPVLRRLLAYFLELNEADRFRAAHLAAFEFHRAHLDRFPQYLARYVPELAYHRATLARCEPSEPSLITWEQWWVQFLSDKAPNYPEPWFELVKVLRQDEELQELLSDDDYQGLLSQAEQRADN